MVSREKYILDTVEDLVTSFLYYDRKEDETLGIGFIEQAVKDGLISPGDIVGKFSDLIYKHLS